MPPSTFWLEPIPPSPSSSSSPASEQSFIITWDCCTLRQSTTFTPLSSPSSPHPSSLSATSHPTENRSIHRNHVYQNGHKGDNKPRPTPIPESLPLLPPACHPSRYSTDHPFTDNTNAHPLPSPTTSTRTHITTPPELHWILAHRSHPSASTTTSTVAASPPTTADLTASHQQTPGPVSTPTPALWSAHEFSDFQCGHCAWRCWGTDVEGLRAHLGREIGRIGREAAEEMEGDEREGARPDGEGGDGGDGGGGGEDGLGVDVGVIEGAGRRGDGSGQSHAGGP